MDGVKVPARLEPYRSKLEAAYAEELENRRRVGRIREWHYELVTLRLGHDCRLTVDFLVVTADGEVQLHETKGYRYPKNMIKLRVAARLTPFPIYLIEREKGEWNKTRMQP